MNAAPLLARVARALAAARLEAVLHEREGDM